MPDREEDFEEIEAPTEVMMPRVYMAKVTDAEFTEKAPVCPVDLGSENICDSCA